MHNFSQALWVEFLKARRSRMPLFTTLGFLLLPLVGGFFMIILKDPESARRAGLITAKAQLMSGTADWPSYLNLLAQGAAVAGLILFGFVVAWVFGREYADRTVKDLLALPTPRSAIVLAKFVVVFAWAAAALAVTLVAAVAVGTAVGLPQFSTAILAQGLLVIIAASGLTMLLVTPFAFAASAGHGYLPALAAVILAIMLAQVAVVAGWGAYLPWAIPALFSQGSPLGAASYGLVLLTGIGGIVLTLLWWEWADQTV